MSTQATQTPQAELPFTDMELARKLFTSKAAVVRRVLERYPPEVRPIAREIADQANSLVSGLPKDLQDRLGVVTPQDVKNAFKRYKAQEQTPQTQDQAKESPSAPPSSPCPPNRRKVSWTEAEEQFLANLVVPMRLESPEPLLTELCRRAQEQLPEHRHRTIDTAHNIKPLVLRIKQGLQQVKDQAEKAQSEPSIDRIEAAPPPILTPDEVLESMSDEALLYYLSSREISLPALLPLLTDKLVKRLEAQGSKKVEEPETRKLEVRLEGLERKIDQALNAMSSIVRQQSHPEVNGTHASPKEETKKLPRIAILGPRKDQFDELERVCRKHVRLRWITKDSRTPNFNPSDDWVFLFTKWIGHDLQDQAEKAVGKQKIILHPGSITTAIDAIINLAKVTKVS